MSFLFVKEDGITFAAICIEDVSAVRYSDNGLVITVHMKSGTIHKYVFVDTLLASEAMQDIVMRLRNKI